ncbi:MAG: DUF4431 domain-containing protein [Nitrospirae bacterium]|nr:DUF4431 domain-containing protein [Nitrospirota bacterium]
MKGKFILLIASAISLIFCFMACAPEARSEECLSYEPAKITLNGVIESKIFPGPPEFESIEKGDRPEIHWILKLSKPVCVSGDPKNEINTETERDIKEIQLIIQEDDGRYMHLLSRRVVVTGTLFHAHTGHHRTVVLMEVISMNLSKDGNKR